MDINKFSLPCLHCAVSRLTIINSSIFELLHGGNYHYAARVYVHILDCMHVYAWTR